MVMTTSPRQDLFTFPFSLTSPISRVDSSVTFPLCSHGAVRLIECLMTSQINVT